VHTSRLLAGSAVVAVLAGTAACGLQSLEPKLELRDAMSAFTSTGSEGFRLSFPSSMPAVRAFADEAAKESGGSASAGPSAADLQKLLSSRLDVALDRGADAKDPADDATRALVHIGGLDVAEIRDVARVAYAKVDFPALETVFPGVKDGVDSMQSQLMGDGTPESVPPPALSRPMTALLAGNWVSMDVSKTSWLAQQVQKNQAGGVVGGTAVPPSAAWTSLVAKAFPAGTVKVTRLDSDDRLGDHLVAAANLRTVYGNLEPELARLLARMPSGKDVHLPPVGGVPDREGYVSFWVKDGALTRAELEAAQFLDKPAGHLVLRFEPRAATTTTAPPGAVAIDMKGIAEIAQGPTVTARTAAFLVDEDIRRRAEQAGMAPTLQYLDVARGDIAGLVQTITLSAVDARIQVGVDGQLACLTLTHTQAVGSVTDGPC
jgi:hypothetical protein